uniref:Uncharacterized protein n=1 Tax=Anguilla anguilla TaxID=7936 RepID=A0A0E9QJC0_ANGAN
MAISKVSLYNQVLTTLNDQVLNK